MAWRNLRAAAIALPVAAAIILAIPDPMRADDGERILKGLLGVGIGVILNEAQRKQNEPIRRDRVYNKAPAAENTAKRSEPKLAADQVFVIQFHLNELGLDVGTPDGGIGENTRRGIRRYQESIGAPPTGYLTAAQSKMLLAGQPSAIEIAAGNPDLLAPTEVESLQKALKAEGYKIGKIDGVIGPATGRTIAKFLTDRGNDPYQTSIRAAYELAVNGGGAVIAGGGNVAVAGETEGERSLFSAMPQGAGDASPKEAASEAGLAAAAGSSTSQQKGIDPGTYVLPGEASGFDLDRELARRALHAVPSLADDPEIVRSWLENDHTENDHFYKRDTSGIAKLYWDGTQFDRADALKQFRTELPAQATADGMKVVLTLEAVLRGKHDPEKGFPLRIKNSVDYGIERFEVYNRRLGADIVMTFPGAPGLGWIPVTNEADARKIASAINDNGLSKLTVTMLVSIGKVGPETMASNGDLSGVIAEATLDGLSIGGKGIELYRWNVSAPQDAVAGNGLDAPSFAKFAGIPIIDGHLAAYDTNTQLAIPKLYRAETHGPSWQRLVHMARLAADPGMLDDDQMALTYAGFVLSEADRLRLSGGKDIFSDGYWARESVDEFDRREIIDRLRTEFVGKIRAMAPQLPLPVVEVRAAVLGNYDFDNGKFPIGIQDSSADKGPADFLANFLDDKYRGIPVSVEHALRAYPTELEMESAKAKFLLDHLEAKGRARRVYIAVFSQTSVAVNENKDGIRLEVEPQRLAVFADPQLNELIHEYPLGDYLKKPPAPVDPGVQHVADVVALQPTPSHVFAREAENYPASKGYLEAYLRSASSYRSANEFDREEVLASLRTAVDETDKGKTDLWLSGTIKLGEYDAARKGFAGVSISLASGRSEIGSFGAELEHKLFNTADLALVPVDRDVAERAVQQTSNREFEIRARVKPVGAVWDREKNAEAYPEVVFEQRVVELYVLSGQVKATGDRDILAHMVLGDAEPAAQAAAASGERALPDRPVLSQDLLLTIATKDRLEGLSSRSMTWLLTNRWVSDNLVGSNLPAKFFDKDTAPPNAATAPAYIEPFKSWAKSLRAEMPKKITLVWERDGSVATPPGETGYLTELIHQQCHHLSANAVNRRFPIGMGLPPEQELFQKQVNGPLEGTADDPVVMQPAYLGFLRNSAFACVEGEPDSEWAPRIVVVLDRLPMPPRDNLGNLAEIDAIIEKVTPYDNGDDLPSLRVDVKFEEVRFLDYRKASASAKPQATLLKVFRAAEMDTAAAVANEANAGVDVLGIRLGQSFEEAGRILTRHFGDPHIVDSETGYSANPASFQNTRVYLRKDGREFVALFYEPSKDGKTVIAIYRNLVAPLGEFDAKDVLVSVRAKYGAEALNKSNDNGLELFWGKNVAKKSLGGSGPLEETDCMVGMGQHTPGSWVKDGQRLDTLARLMPWEEVRDHGFMSWPRLDRPEDMKKYEKCGAFLRVKHFSWKMNGMSTFLVDIKAYQEAFANAGKHSEEEINSNVQNGGGIPKLKL